MVIGFYISQSTIQQNGLNGPAVIKKPTFITISALFHCFTVAFLLDCTALIRWFWLHFIQWNTLDILTPASIFTSPPWCGRFTVLCRIFLWGEVDNLNIMSPRRVWWLALYVLITHLNFFWSKIGGVSCPQTNISVICLFPSFYYQILKVVGRG